MATGAEVTTPAVEAARLHREALRKALVALEDAISEPVPGRVQDWTANVIEKLSVVGREFADHIHVTEEDEGLFTEILERSPRLTHAVDRLRTDHDQLHADIAKGLDDLRGGSRAAEEIREALLLLLGRLARHRQRGADLVYEAYCVDVGGQD